MDYDSDGFPSFFPKQGQNAPYVYFNARSYGLVDASSIPLAKFDAVANSVTEGKGVARPYRERFDTATSTWIFHGNDSYQIISGGLDGDYGAETSNPVTEFKQYPAGTYFQLGDRSNFASFAEGRLDKNLDF